MIEDAIANFFNLPGVIGLGIFQIQGQVKSYLHFKEQLITEGKQSLSGSIINLVEHLVKFPNLDFFEFPVRSYYTYIYKINPTVTLLVLTVQYSPAIKMLAGKQLQTTIRKDIDTAITTIQVLSNSFKSITISPAITAATAKINNKVSSEEEKFTIKDYLETLNKISKFTISYLGLKLTKSCWQLSCPKFEWLEYFEVTSSAEITFSGQGTQEVSKLQDYWLKEWIDAFIKQTAKIIKDLPTLLEIKCLNEREKRILLFPITNEVKNYSFLPNNFVQ